jgi:hypothetical protein
MIVGAVLVYHSLPVRCGVNPRCTGMPAAAGSA